MAKRRSQHLPRKSLKYYDQKRRSRDLDIGLYERMFSEDIHLAIMPIGGRSHANPDFSVSIDPHSEELKALLLDTLPTRNGYSRYSLAETVCAFVDECAMILGAYGVAYYEKVHGDKPEAGAPPPFQLARIHNPCIHRTFGLMWQFVPTHVWRKQKEMAELVPPQAPSRRWAFLTRRDVAVIEMPSLLGGPAGFRRTLSDLHHLGSLGASQLVIADMNADAKNRSGYDLAVHRQSNDEHLARVTRKWGWMGRSLLRERVTEFYQFHRWLVFERAKAILREHIISELNRHLEDLGNRLGFCGGIVVSGLPSASDCEDAIGRLAAGEMQFKDVAEFMRKV